MENLFVSKEDEIVYAAMDLHSRHFNFYDLLQTGIPNLLRQLNADQIKVVGQLPKELVILAKYANVGIDIVEKLFEQLKQKQDQR